MAIPEEQIPTAELPDLSEMPEPEHLTKQEIELSTADTKPLPHDMAEASMAFQPKPRQTRDEDLRAAEPRVEEVRSEEPKAEEQKVEAVEAAPAMDTKTTEPASMGTEMKQRSSGPLLDLGYLEQSTAGVAEDFVLDLDFDDSPDPAETGSFQSQQFAHRGFAGAAGTGTQMETGVIESDDTAVNDEPVEDQIRPTVDPMAQTQEMMHPVLRPPARAEAERTFTEPEILEAETLRMTLPLTEARSTEAISPDQLSPEVIDAIARRAVEMLSERVVQQIAWEVVPQLAELMIKRQLEEKSS